MVAETPTRPEQCDETERAKKAAQRVADSYGYRFAVMTDGTILLHPPLLDPDCCEICAQEASRA